MPTAFELTASRATTKGVVISTYRRAGAVAHGDATLR